jgi:hypothetical protein
MEKKFSDLGVSTKTVMAYSNVLLNVESIFNKLDVYEISDPPLTKKKKLPNLKLLDSPHGKIVSLRLKNKFRGLVTKRLEGKQLENATKYFLNQITCVISLGDKRNINVFIFKTSFKIVGCKTQKTAEEVVAILWEQYIKPMKDCYVIKDDDPPNFTFETVMTNVDFSLGFDIDRKKLNTLLNLPQFKDRIHMSRYETTGNANVNVQFKITNSDEHYLKMSDNNGKWVITNVDDISYKDNKKKKKKKHTTFLVFQSSKTIASARYTINMESDYNYFINLINKNRDLIEETNTRTTQEPFSF